MLYLMISVYPAWYELLQWVMNCTKLDQLRRMLELRSWSE